MQKRRLQTKQGGPSILKQGSLPILNDDKRKLCSKLDFGNSMDAMREIVHPFSIVGVMKQDP